MLVLVVAEGCSGAQKTAPPPPPSYTLPPLQEPGKPYHTPRAGEGFRTEVLGKEVAVPPRDRSSVTAWDLGMVAVAPGVTQNEVLPFASLYLWRRPDEDNFLRAIIVGVYNDIFVSKSSQPLRPFEGILGLRTVTLPRADADYVDGERIKEEELYWGKIQPAIGVGYREDLEEPGANDNMLSVSLLAEPTYLYFEEGPDTADNFVEPQDTFEGRGHFMVRLDAVERNLLELPHRGLALGSDLVYAHRTNWEDWGIDRKESHKTGKDYVYFTGYMVGAGGVPLVDSDRHRLVGSIHGGTGDSLDRFSALRVGGGPSGDEFDSLWRPLVPGALLDEFATNHYVIALGEYRWEAIFFTYLSVRSSVAYVDRERDLGAERGERDDFLYSIGWRITTGFLFETRMVLDYNYNTGVLRHGDFGGHEVVVHMSGSF